MFLLEISDTEKAGEIRWGVSLIDETGSAILRNLTPLAKGVALSTAKALKHKGPDAPFVEDGPVDAQRPVWIAEKTDRGWSAKFSLVGETSFDLFLKPEDAADWIKVVETALHVVKTNLAKATIEWVPPEADPAYVEKETDLTPTLGIPGS